MGKRLMDHPSSEQIALLLDDRLDEPVRSSVAEHIDACRTCQAALDDVVGDELEAWKPISRRPVAPIAAGPAYERAVQRAAETLGAGADGPINLEEILEPPRHAGDIGALSQYRIISVLGHGGMGVVFEAVDPALERTVALKVLRSAQSDHGARQRFVREAQTAAKIKHDHVVTVFAVSNPPGGAPYLAMEFLPGPTFRDLIITRGRLAPRLAAELCAQAAEGVAAAHAAGLVHRDIKPNNILLAPVGDRSHDAHDFAKNGSGRDGRRGPGRCPWRAKIADFGLARPVEHSGVQTLDGALCGTPVYISPEQIRDPSVVDGRCDVYSLGVTLYEALTGEVPFRGTTPMVLQQAVSDEPRPPGRMAEGVPRDVETICLKAMAKEPERRYASPKAFADDLRRWLRSEPIVARPSSSLEQLSRWCKRNPRVAVLSASLAALLLVTAIGSVTAALLIARAERRTGKALAAAKDQRSLALDTLNDLVSRVQNILADRPGTLALREQILTNALKNLERITRDADSGKIIDHDTVAAHQRIGDVLWMSGRNDQARSHYAQSQKLAQALDAASGGAEQTERDLAWAHDKLGVLDQHALRLDAALDHYRMALQLRERAIQRSPKNVEAKRELVASVKRLGDVASLKGEHSQARDAFERALILAQQLREAAPDDLLIRRDVMNSMRKLSWACLALGDAAAAEKQLSQATTLLGSLRESDPENLTWRQEEAWIQQDFGALGYQKRDYASAVTHQLKAIEAQTAIVRSDPEQAEFLWNLAQVESRLSSSYLALGRYQDAREHAAAAARTAEAIAEKHPSSTKFGNDASVALYELGSIEWRLDHIGEAERQYQKSLQLLRRIEASGELQSVGMKTFKDLIERVVAVMPLRQQAIESLEFVEKQPAPAASVLLAIRAYDLARARRFDESLATADRAVANQPKDAYIAGMYWYTIARTYGIVAAGLAADAQSEGADKQKLRRCVAGAKDSLRRCLEIAPSMSGYIIHEPELRSVR
jgi:serine/threonine protein kinase